MLQLPRPDLRSLVPILLVAPLAAAIPRLATAGPQATRPEVDLGDATMEINAWVPDDDDEGDYRPASSDVERKEFFNRANCICSDVTFGARLKLSERPNADLRVDIWAGTDCANTDNTVRDNQCRQVGSYDDVDDLFSEKVLPVRVNNLIQNPRQSSCPSIEVGRTIYAIIDEDLGGFSDGDKEFHSDPIDVDTQPPPEPDNVKARGSENSIVVTWDIPVEGRGDDIKYVQLLCMRADGSTDPADGFPRDITQRYLTASEVCGGTDTTTCPHPLGTSNDDDDGDDDDDGGRIDAGTSIDAGSTLALGGGPDAGATDAAPDAGESSECSTDLPGNLATLDPDLLCADVTGTEGELRATDLQNGIDYHVVLVVVDESRNVNAIDLGVYTPAAVTDFWEGYKKNGGQAKGGCSAGEAGLGGGLFLVFAIALGFGLPALRRRRGQRRGKGSIAGGAALLLALGLSSRIASAQPWWEGYGDEEPVPEQAVPSVPHWGFELKVGPYYPDVDSEFSGDVHPLKDMYGDGPFVLSGFTLDRYLLYPMGQLGVSFSAGFLSWSANAFKEDLNGDPVDKNEDGKPDRAIGDTTAFRLIPTSLGVVYRFTGLDDQFRVPLVPYGRLGLSYYYWWITKPDGSVAEFPTPSCPDLEGCSGDKARGGSLGWQATAGLAVRVERIDPDAEVSLRSELGIEHAGLVFEFTYAKVDGFGAGDKMSVGDATWFGGINFEF